MMAQDEKIDNLRASPLFRDLPQDELEQIAGIAESIIVPHHEVLFEEGDPADNFYIICSGSVRVFLKHEHSVERELAVLGPGDNFGEVGLLTNEPRSAGVRALGETHLLSISKDHFERLLEQYPDLSKRFVKEMRSWLLKDQEIIGEDANAAFKSLRVSWLDFIVIVGVSVLLALTFNHSNPNGIPLFPALSDKDSVPSISASQAMEEYQSDKAIIIDAMPPNFYQKRHIKRALNMPMSLFDIVYLINFSEEKKDRGILVYGSTISRPYDMEVAAKLMLRGHTDVRIIEGGLPVWEAKGYPVEEKAGK